LLFERYRPPATLVDAEAAGNTAFRHTALHVLDEQHADGTDINTGFAAGAPERINFNSHSISSLAQASLAESVNQGFNLLL